MLHRCCIPKLAQAKRAQRRYTTELHTRRAAPSETKYPQRPKTTSTTGPHRSLKHGVSEIDAKLSVMILHEAVRTFTSVISPQRRYITTNVREEVKLNNQSMATIPIGGTGNGLLPRSCAQIHNPNPQRYISCAYSYFRGPEHTRPRWR